MKRIDGVQASEFEYERLSAALARHRREVLARDSGAAKKPADRGTIALLDREYGYRILTWGILAAERMFRETMTEKARQLPWHEFVCDYVAQRTASTPAEGYRFVPSGGRWAMVFGSGSATDLVGPASTIYGWLERTMAFRPLMLEADRFRGEVLS